MSNVLCIDDETAVGVMLERSLADLGHQAVLTTSVEDGIQALARSAFDLIISDYRMPNATGLDLLNQLREQGVETPVIIMTAYSTIEHAVLSMRHGAVDYLTKPIRAEALRLAVTNAIEMARLRRQNDQYRQELQTLRGTRTIVGSGPSMTRVLDLIEQVAPSRATVLLEGESGTGKELFARAIHARSPRREEAFISVNCAALPEGLVESTLFGHERGAFTGANQRQLGAFERAHRGTLLLDEVSEMRLDMQAKLLRAIQEQEFERVGGAQTVRVDARIVATTNRDLQKDVREGRFREDLYYRLNVVPIRTPPLRERLEDLPALAEHFVDLASRAMGVRAPELRPDAVRALSARPWPGNVRELANVIERAVILSRGQALTAETFAEIAPAALGHTQAAGNPVAEAFGQTTGAGGETFDLGELERRTIERALASTGGHRSKTARLLGISERTLRNKLNRRDT